MQHGTFKLDWLKRYDHLDRSLPKTGRFENCWHLDDRSTRKRVHFEIKLFENDHFGNNLLRNR